MNNCKEKNTSIFLTELRRVNLKSFQSISNQICSPSDSIRQSKGLKKIHLISCEWEKHTFTHKERKRKDHSIYVWIEAKSLSLDFFYGNENEWVFHSNCKWILSDWAVNKKEEKHHQETKYWVYSHFALIKINFLITAFLLCQKNWKIKKKLNKIFRIWSH